MASKNTKRALLSSLLVLALCFTMLLGTTFAWFTDSVNSGSNIIKSGNLEVALVDADGNSLEGEMIEWAAADGRDQDEILWEPGCTYNTEEFYVKNVGNLNLKFKVVINGIDGDAKLLEAIDFSAGVENYTVTVEHAWGTLETTTDIDLINGTTIEDPLSGTTSTIDEYILEPGEEMGPIVLTGHMREDAGNEYQNLTIDGISVSIVATQAVGEEDSFDGMYDANATYPVATTEELNDALTNAEAGDTIVLANGTWELPAEISTSLNIVGSGDTTISTTLPAGGDIEDETAAINVQAADVTIKNVTFDAANDGNDGSIILSTGENLTVEDCTFDMTGTNNAGVYLFNNDSATIKNCTFKGGYKSIYVNGKDADTDTDTDELVIENCTFEGTYALHVGGAANIVVNNCEFNGVAITLWNGTAIFTDCAFNNDPYNQILNYYAPVTFNNCFFGSEFVYALRQAVNEVNVVVNNATYETEGSTFAAQCGWSIVTNGSLTSYTVTEDGTAAVIPTSQKV